MSADLKYRRVLLKLSGEALMGAREYGLDPVMAAGIAGEIQSVHDLGVEVFLVIGGAICEPYIRRRALRHLEKKRVVIFAAGTGNPFFTTDTAAALRASEMGCDALLKATKVDGVYDADPERVVGARRFERLNYLEVLSRDLRVMDASAISLARENHIPILVFSIFENGGFAEVVRGRGRHTIIDGRD
jgi:uridylate kinase